MRLSLLCLAVMVVASTAQAFTAKEFLELHDARCADQLENGVWTDTSELVALSSLEVAQTAANLGNAPAPEAIWAPQSADWIVVQHDVDHPEHCLTWSLQVELDDIPFAWIGRFGPGGAWRHAGVPCIQSIDQGRLLSGAFASRPLAGGFVQTGLGGIAANGGVFAELITFFIETTPASCELWPEECS